MFKNINELKNYIEEECQKTAIQHEECYRCGGSLIDSCGFEEYTTLEEYAPNKKFCSEYCLEEFLIEEIGINESVGE